VDRRGGFNAGGNFSVRQNKFNLSAAVFANAMRNKATGTTDRSNYNGDTATRIYQHNVDKTKGAFVFGRLGLDYFISNRTTLSIGGVRVHGEFKPGSSTDISTDSLINNAKLSSIYSERNSKSKRTFNGTGLQLGMKHNFAKEGTNLSADFNYFSGKNSSDALAATDYFNENLSAVTGTQNQNTISSGNNKFITIQTDFESPLSKKQKLEAGLRAQINQLKNLNDVYLQQVGQPDYTKLPSASTNYKNTNDVYAAYATVTSAIKDFGYKVGLRAESSNYDGTLTTTGQKYSNDYPISLFPSVFLSQKLKAKQEIQFSYTRRINRPNFFQLIPYTDYTDSLNITRGNPDLVPEFTNSFEFSYSKTFKGNNSFLASVYYKHTNDLITRYLEQDTNFVSKRVDLINTFINANSSYSYGAELTSINAAAKWWDVTTNINVYKSKNKYRQRF